MDEKQLAEAYPETYGNTKANDEKLTLTDKI